MKEVIKNRRMWEAIWDEVAKQGNWDEELEILKVSGRGGR